MEPEIVFVPSAFKHGVTEADVRYAYKTKIHDRLMERCGDKYGFFGFNRAGNPVEVFYNPIDKVFHAMALRTGVLKEFRD